MQHIFQQYFLMMATGSKLTTPGEGQVFRLVAGKVMILIIMIQPLSFSDQ
jgi:hypothetical protein